MKSFFCHAPRAVLAATIAAALLLGACSKPAPAPEPIRSVKVMTVGLGPVQATVEYAGEVRARVESRLGFRVGGKLIERTVEAGQKVRVGQLLARIDPQDLKLAADAARAQVAAAQTNRDLASSDFKRYQELRAQDFISSAELERRDSSLKAAQAQLEQAQAQLAVQGNQALYSVLRADVAGVITAALAEPGQMLSAGTVVLQLAQDGPRDVVFSVPEDKLTSLKLGTALQVKSWSSGLSLKAQVREIAASADPVTRTYLVKLGLTAQDQLPLGSTVSVLPAALQHAGLPVIKLPTSALKQEGQTAMVWVLDAATMTVKQRPVQISSVDGNEVVLASGLTPGEQVVAAGVHVLAPGQKVSLYQASQSDTVSSAVPNAAARVAAPSAAK
jgi:RND family efflux transporter MFP subunit